MTKGLGSELKHEFPIIVAVTACAEKIDALEHLFMHSCTSKNIAFVLSEQKRSSYSPLSFDIFYVHWLKSVVTKPSVLFFQIWVSMALSDYSHCASTNV